MNYRPYTETDGCDLRDGKRCTSDNKRLYHHGQKPKIFLGGLSENCDKETLHNFFSKYGTITELIIMYDSEKRKSRGKIIQILFHLNHTFVFVGFGFLSFEEISSIYKVVAKHYVHINGKRVSLGDNIIK